MWWLIVITVLRCIDNATSSEFYFQNISFQILYEAASKYFSSAVPKVDLEPCQMFVTEIFYENS